MNKNEWLQIKASKNYPIDILYEFFQAKNTGKEMSIEDFSKNFIHYSNAVGGFNFQRIIEFFDKKLGITKLTDKYGKLLKEY